MRIHPVLLLLPLLLLAACGKSEDKPAASAGPGGGETPDKQPNYLVSRQAAGPEACRNPALLAAPEGATEIDLASLVVPGASGKLRAASMEVYMLSIVDDEKLSAFHGTVLAPSMVGAMAVNCQEMAEGQKFTAADLSAPYLASLADGVISKKLNVSFAIQGGTSISSAALADVAENLVLTPEQKEAERQRQEQLRANGVFNFKTAFRLSEKEFSLREFTGIKDKESGALIQTSIATRLLLE